MWKTIPGFPKYEINESGVIRNAETHYVTSQRMNRQGYLYVQLHDGQKNNVRLVHRLVAETFIPNPDNLPIVNHIDECSVHNSVDNLEWISYKGNSNHGTRNERIIRNRMDSVIAINELGRIVFRYPSKHEAARANSVSESAIRRAIKNKTKCCALYWALENDNVFSENEEDNYVYLLKENYSTKEYHVNNRLGRIPIKAIDSTGKTVFCFRSKKEASERLCVPYKDIITALKYRIQINSLYLEYEKEISKE